METTQAPPKPDFSHIKLVRVHEGIEWQKIFQPVLRLLKPLVCKHTWTEHTYAIAEGTAFEMTGVFYACHKCGKYEKGESTPNNRMNNDTKGGSQN